MSAATDDQIDCENYEATAKADPARALGVCLRLMEKGDAIAEFNIGRMHEKGLGADQSDSLAAFWYRSAANKGLAVAETALGKLLYRGMRWRDYENGREGATAPDYVTSAKWFHKAANQGDVEAQTYLGTMYARGQGVPMDKVQAFLWYSVAIKGGSSAASSLLDALVQDMSPAQTAGANVFATRWKPN